MISLVGICMHEKPKLHTSVVIISKRLVHIVGWSSILYSFLTENKLLV